MAALSLAIALSACGRLIPESRAPAPPPSVSAPTANALLAGLQAGPAVAALGLGQTDAAGALAAFNESCPRLLARRDTSGLTRNADWQGACDAAAKWPAAEAPRFFATWFETARVGDGRSRVTGYYEPEIAGTRSRQTGFDIPVYAMPPDLIRARAGDAPPNDAGLQPPGRYDAEGKFTPYHDRAAIEGGALMGKGLEIAWVADPVEFFFLQIQGSGRLRAPDGTLMRIGYAGQNGYPYTGLGTLMREGGLVGPGTPYATSMQGLMQYLRDNPAASRSLMHENQSYVFFRELNGDAPVGALGVAVRARSSAAGDPAFVPLGAPVFLDVEHAEADGLWIVQDTGGAIRGANRFDSFWGAGDDARRIAGGMNSLGDALVLLPKGTLARLNSP